MMDWSEEEGVDVRWRYPPTTLGIDALLSCFGIR